MKRTLFTLLLFCPWLLSAQKIVSGDLKFLKGQTALHTVLDFSEAQVLGDTGNGRSVLDALLASDSTLLIKKFYYGVTDELESRYFMVGQQPNARYQAIVRVQQISANGRTLSLVDFSEKGKSEVICQMQLVGDGGRFGTFFNLLGDGLKDSGEAFGEVLKKKIK